MIATISLLTSLIFAVLYPLCFWISARDPLKQKFHHFHLGLPSVVGGVATVFILFMDIPPESKGLVALWLVSLLIVAFLSYAKEYPPLSWITWSSFIGMAAFLKMQHHLIGGGIGTVISSVLSGLIFCSSLYTMNLGHWYLNVHGLPISHLRRATYLFWLFIGLRSIWDFGVFFTQKVLYKGNLISVFDFSIRLDGFLIWVAVFFGTLFPLVATYFVKGSIDVRNTQSATGILYVILCSILIGDISYKYYLLKFGIVL